MTTARKQLTLMLVCQEGRVLLGMKKRGFGMGKYNGFGGKVEPGESIEAAALRELREEAGIEALDASKRGVLLFDFVDAYAPPLAVHVFKATRFSGEPVESEEMRPQWFPAADVPFDHMWQDDRHWFPLLLEDARFIGKFEFRADALLAHTLRRVEAEAELRADFGAKADAVTPTGPLQATASGLP